MKSIEKLLISKGIQIKDGKLSTKDLKKVRDILVTENSRVGIKLTDANGEVITSNKLAGPTRLGFVWLAEQMTHSSVEETAKSIVKSASSLTSLTWDGEYIHETVIISAIEGTEIARVNRGDKDSVSEALAAVSGYLRGL